jgi:4-amino-4-deoxy-L-arabinose transferase-like glycosyltransferase
LAEKEFEIEIKTNTTTLLIFSIVIVLVYALVFLLNSFSFLWYFDLFGIIALTTVFVYILYKADRTDIMLLLLLLEISMFVLLSEIQITISSPIAFGDEAYHTQLAKLIAKNVEYYVWMPFEGSNVENQAFGRPPLWNLLEASFYYLFGFNPIIVEILTPFVSVLTCIAIYVIFKKLFNSTVGFFAALITLTLPSIVTYADLFYVDTLSVFWIALFLGFFLLFEKTEKKKYLIASTIFAAFTALTKITGFAIFFFYGIYFIYEIIKTKNFKVIKKYIFITVLLAIFLGGFAIRSLYYYKTPLCGLPMILPFMKQECSITSNYTPKYEFSGRTASVSTEVSVYNLGLISYFNFAYGTIWFVPLVFIIGIMMLVVKREKDDIILALFLISMLPVFFLTYPGRAEDAARYTLVAVPVIALIAANYLDVLLSFLSKYRRILTLFFILTIIVVSIVNFYGKNSTMSQVKQFSPLFLSACNWVKNNLPENATLLSLYGHPTVYNCDRNAVWVLQDLPDIILSNDLNLTTNRLKTDGIGYIFVQKFALSQQAYSQNYPLSFIQFLTTYPKTFVNVYENGPDLNSCVIQGGCDGTIIYYVNTTGV